MLNVRIRPFILSSDGIIRAVFHRTICIALLVIVVGMLKLRCWRWVKVWKSTTLSLRKHHHGPRNSMLAVIHEVSYGTGLG